MPRLFTEEGKIRNFNGVWGVKNFNEQHRKEWNNSQTVKPKCTTPSQKQSVNKHCQLEQQWK